MRMLEFELCDNLNRNTRRRAKSSSRINMASDWESWDPGFRLASCSLPRSDNSRREGIHPSLTRIGGVHRVRNWTVWNSRSRG